MLARIGVPARLSDPAVDTRVAFADRLIAVICDHITAVGGEPVILQPEDMSCRPDIDGLILPGGGDVEPQLYGQEPHPSVYDTNPEQDMLDLTAARFALDNGLPVFGICRGMQVINVLYGGTLIQDLPPSDITHRHQRTGPVTDLSSAFIRHGIAVTPGSRLAEIVGTATEAASAHHQAVETVGAGLTVTARAADGCIEAFEDPGRRLIAVQWHPEVQAGSEPDKLALFDALVAAARCKTAA